MDDEKNTEDKNETVDEVIKDVISFDDDFIVEDEDIPEQENSEQSETEEIFEDVFDDDFVIEPKDEPYNESYKKSYIDDTQSDTDVLDNTAVFKVPKEYGEKALNDEFDGDSEEDFREDFKEYSENDYEVTEEKENRGKTDIEPDEDEGFNYDYGYNEPDFGDTRLVVPMIKPIVKKLIPLCIVLLIMIYFMTSENFLVRNYRENFVRNIERIASNAGLNLSKQNTDNAAGNVDTADNTDNMVEYKETDKKKTEEEVQYRTETQSDVMISFDGASDSKFVRYGDGVLCAATNYICYINTDGEVVWEKNVAVTDPILKAEGDYFLLAQRGGTKFTMYKGETAVVDKNSDDNILTANVSSEGDIILVTNKAGFKGAVAVYNRRGDNAFEWSSGSSSIISADIAAGSRKVAVSLLNTESTVKSSVYLFDMRQTESYAKQEFNDSIIYTVDFKEKSLNILADNAFIGMNLNGKITHRIDYGDSEVTRASLTDDGSKAILFTGTNIPMLNVYNKNGKLKKTVSLDKVPDYAYINDDNIVYNLDREIIMGKINRKIPYKYTAIMDIKGIVPIDDNSFMVIYSNSVSMVKMKGLL